MSGFGCSDQLKRGVLRCFLDIRFEKLSLVDSLDQILFPTFLQAPFAVPDDPHSSELSPLACFVCFPNIPFLLPGVVVFLDQLSLSFSWASLRRLAFTIQSEILEKPPAAAWNRCCLSTQHNIPNLLKIQSLSQTPMISRFCAELPNICVSAPLLQSSMSWIAWLNSPNGFQ
jgi:hypothetical protein